MIKVTEGYDDIHEFVDYDLADELIIEQQTKEFFDDFLNFHIED